MIVRQAALKAALATVQKSIAIRSTLPVLEYVNLYADGDTVQVQGSDLETFTRATIACAEEAGENVCVNYKMFSRFINALEDGDITLEANAIKLKVKQGTTEIDFPIIPGEEFPIVPPVKDEHSLYIDAQDLALAFGRVVHAAATDEGRPVLTGVYVLLSDSVLTTVCADGFRMAVSNINVDSESNFSVLIPAKSVRQVLSAMGDGPVAISADHMRIAFDLPEKDGVEVFVVCQTIEGNFVNYRQIIPAQSAGAWLDKEKFEKAVMLAGFLANTSANVVHHILCTDKIHIHSQDDTGGTYDADVKASYNGEEFTFGLNFSYVLDAISHMYDTVVLEATKPMRPVCIYPSGHREDYLCVLMPMHIRN